jgi:hypothetical protein
LVVAKVGEKLAVSKRAGKKMDLERFIVKELNEEEVKEQYQVTMKNKFAALENIDDNGEVSRTRVATRENVKIFGQGQYQPNHRKPWFCWDMFKISCSKEAG